MTAGSASVPGTRKRNAGKTRDALLEKVYAELEISAARVNALPRISHLLKPAGNTAQIVEYLRHSEEPDAVAVCAQADRLIKYVGAKRHVLLEAASVEALCAAAGVSPKKLFGIIAAEVAEQSAQATALLSKAMHPKVLEKTIQYAMKEGGMADRKMIHQAEQYLPVPKTSVTFAKHIDARTQTQNVAILKPLEDSMKRLSNRFLEMAPPEPVESPADSEGDA